MRTVRSIRGGSVEEPVGRIDEDVVALVLDSDPRSELVRSGDIGRVAVVSGALEDFATVERAVNLHEVDTVFHLGAQTVVGVAHRWPLATFEANVRGTWNLLEVCRIHAATVRRANSSPGPSPRRG